MCVARVMEDLKKRLEFDNPYIQDQAVWRLFAEVEKKRGKEQITPDTPETPELRLLWDAACGDHSPVAKVASEALVALVVEGAATFPYVMHGFINRVPSARSVGGLVSAVGELMMMHAVAMEDAGNNYVCPYSLRSPTHPFITILTHRPVSWPLLLAQCERLALHGDIRVRRVAAEIVRPWVQFVLVDPSPSLPQAPLHRQQLQRLLVTIYSGTAHNSWLHLMMDALPCYQVNTWEEVSQLSLHVRDLLATLGSTDACEVERVGVVQSGVSLLLALFRHKLDMSGLVGDLLDLLKTHPGCVKMSTTLISDLCQLLMELGPLSPPHLLSLVERVVTSLSADDSCVVDVSVLVLPLLQLAWSPRARRGEGGGGGGSGLRRAVVAATSALQKVEALLAGRSKTSTKNTATGDVLPSLSVASVQGYANSQLMSAIMGNVEDTCTWLLDLQQHLAGVSEPQTLPSQLTCAVVGMLVSHRSPEVTRPALDVLANMARLDKTKAPLFLPLLLYCLRMEPVPEIRLLLLEHIPKMAQHKFCIAPILKSIQALMTSPRLQPVAIRLMTSLWEIQDRCFPQLLKAIGEDETSTKSSAKLPKPSPDVLLARAAAIRDICRLKPEQHGADLLAPLQTILKTAMGNDGGPASALALEGLYYLCEAEVIDIQSAWGVIGKQLSKDGRGVVIQRVCELFSLVPSLAVKTPQYEQFHSDCVMSLWLYTTSSDPLVQGAAFQALASYSADCFRVSHLPRQVCEDLYQQVEVMQQQQQDSGEENTVIDVDTVFTYIPGVCYTRLLRSLPDKVLEDFEGFLSSLVGREADGLPRGIYHLATRRQGTSSNQDKAIASIPAFLSTQYEKTKQPGLRPSLAASLLFCYDPPVEVGRDGRPRKHYLIKHGKLFLDTFKTLLNEIPIQPSEWHRTMLMPQAWVSFIDRLFHTLIESRKAELELQVKHGHISNDQLTEKQHTAWLFARDSIVDVLKAASRGNPSQQANAVLALTGVTVFTSRMAGSLDPGVLKECDAATEHVSHSHWLTMAVDTILSLRDVRYRPRGKLLGLCQQRSAEDRTAAGMLTRSTSCLSLAPLIPCLITGHADLVLLMVRELTGSLPGGKEAESPALAFHTGLGLGIMLGRLFEEHFADITGKEGMTAMWKSLGALEDSCFSTAIDNRTGCLLGLGFALTGLCTEGKTDSRVHVTICHEKLTTLLEQTSVDNNSYQALCVCLACITGTAFGANILPIERVNATLHELETSHHQHPMVSGASLSLGMLCYSLSKMGHPGMTTLRQTLTTRWLKTLTTDSPPMDKVAALNGLMALIGSEQTLIVVQSGVSLTSSDVKVSEVIQVVSRIVQSDPDLGIQCNAAWMLGHLYLSASAVAENRASVPPSYSYLPEDSFLRAIVDLLLEAGKHGPEFVKQKLVKVALTALQDEVRHVLPPLNWAGVLSPLMRMQFGVTCQRLCLSLAISQSAASPTAAMFLSSWLTPPLVLTLDDDSRQALFSSLPKLIKSVPLAVLSTFLERTCCHMMSGEGFRPEMAVCVLRGMAAAIKVPDPPEAVTSLLFQTAGRLYSLLPDTFHPTVYGCMAECLASVPDDIFDSITANDYRSGFCCLRGFYVGCYLVAGGSQPITLLNGLIDTAMNDSQCGKDSLLYILAHCFWKLVSNRTETSGPMARLNWLVELLGHTRNMASGAVPLSSPSQSLAKAMEFSVIVVAMALSLLTDTRPSPDFGLDPKLLNVRGGGEVKGEGHGVPGWSAELRVTFLQRLPVAVQRFQHTPWDQVLPKVFDWLLSMSRLADDIMPSSYKQACTAAMLMLRHSTEFRKTATWTRVLAQTSRTSR